MTSLQSLAENDYLSVANYTRDLDRSHIGFNFYPEVRLREEELANPRLLDSIYLHDPDFFNQIVGYTDWGHPLPDWILFKLQKTYYTRATLGSVKRLSHRLDNFYETGRGYVQPSVIGDDLAAIYDGLSRQIHFRDWESKILLLRGQTPNPGHLTYRKRLREWVRVVEDWYVRTRQYQRLKPPPLSLTSRDFSDLKETTGDLIDFLENSTHFY